MTEIAQVPESSPLRTVVLLALAIIVFVFADRILETAQLADSHADAVRFYTEGQRLLQQGQNAKAVDEFESAISEERANRNYQLAFGEALFAAGKPDAAENALNAVLEKNSAWAEANLALARVLVKEGRLADGIVYYHRAIYGQWGGDAHAGQVSVRFELADLLSRENSQEALLSELLPLENDAPNDIATRQRLANLFISAGSPARAASIFRDLQRTHAADAELYAGVGEAEFARGNYRVAQAQFQAALGLNPADARSRERLDLTEQVLRLDPASRGLGADEQYERSRKIVEIVLNDLGQCPGLNASPGAQDLIKTIAAAQKQPVIAARKAAAVEDNLTLAERLWQVRKTECKQPVSETEESVALVLAMPAR